MSRCEDAAVRGSGRTRDMLMAAITTEEMGLSVAVVAANAREADRLADMWATLRGVRVERLRRMVASPYDITKFRGLRLDHYFVDHRLADEGGLDLVFVRDVLHSAGARPGFVG